MRGSSQGNSQPDGLTKNHINCFYPEKRACPTSSINAKWNTSDNELIGFLGKPSGIGFMDSQLLAMPITQVMVVAII